MYNLYPLKFKPFLLDKVWGGHNLSQKLKKCEPQREQLGESWEISTFNQYVSEVSCGDLKGKNLTDLIHLYKDELMGKKNYDTFGTMFPLLVKFIDTSQFLSLQVHPEDDFAKQYFNQNGKSEIWYIIEHEEHAKLIRGFNTKMTNTEFVERLNTKKLEEVLFYDDVAKEDIVYVPAGCLHGIGPGILLVEIQQCSDLTFRVYDWDRNGIDGKPRELHTELALQVINFEDREDTKIEYAKTLNTEAHVIANDFFKINYLWFDNELTRDYLAIDSFVIYVCVHGECLIKYQDSKEVRLEFGETILIPASIKNITLKTINNKECKILETFVCEMVND